MTRKQTEAKQVSEIEALGLVREVHHKPFKEPVLYSGILEPVNGVTIVTLHTRDEHEEWLKRIDGLTREQRQQLTRSHVGYGEAVCSGKDNYNKKIGRTIATARAIQNYKTLC